MRQRGNTIVMYLLLAVGFLSVAWAAVAWHARVNYERGVAETTVKWEAANRRAAQEQRDRELAVEDQIRAADQQRLAAERAARNSDQRWREALNEANRTKVALGACVQQPAPGNAPGAVADGVGGVGRAADPVRVTREFVRLYDAAWTGAGGEPVFDTAAWGAGTAAADPTRYGLADVLAVHGENAQRCSEDRRTLQSLMDSIRRAEKAWAQ